MKISERKKVYFVSDVHLGAPVLDNDRERENRLIRWLDTIRPDCSELFLLGDIFDFWFEYKRAVPKGHVRFLAKICEFTDQGIPVHFFTGNHDIWAFGYLPEECGVILHTHNEIFRIAGKRFLIGHGDALNPQDKGYLHSGERKKKRSSVFAGKCCKDNISIISFSDTGICLSIILSRQAAAISTQGTGSPIIVSPVSTVGK